MLTGGNISPGDKGYKCVLAPATLPGTTSGNDGVEEVEEGGKLLALSNSAPFPPVEKPAVLEGKRTQIDHLQLRALPALDVMGSFAC